MQQEEPSSRRKPGSRPSVLVQEPKKTKELKLDPGLRRDDDFLIVDVVLIPQCVTLIGNWYYMPDLSFVGFFLMREPGYTVFPYRLDVMQRRKNRIVLPPTIMQSHPEAQISQPQGALAWGPP